MIVYLYSFLVVCAKFLIYSFFGWIIEVCVSYNDNKKFINRGFLIGPYIPIYGVCALLLTLILKNEINPIYIFMMSMFLASILEYVTSYLMEKIFKARWWDYSNIPFNVNGRICLVYSFAFGILGYLLIALIDPKLSFYISSVDPFWFSLVMIIAVFFFVFDVILSFNIMQKIKLTAESVKKDYTEEITKKVRKILYDKSKNFQRLFDAFPNVNVLSKFNKRKK